MQSVVITGASTGIGWATAKLLLDRGFRVFGSVRKQADAERLKREFGANFAPLLFDVTDEAAVLAAAREVRVALNGETLFGLVNNAGIAVRGAGARTRCRRISPPDGCKRDRADHLDARPSARCSGRSVAERAEGPDRDDQLGGRQKRQPADGGLLGLQARDRGTVGKPAPRDDAVRHRCYYHRAGPGEDADLEQGPGGRRHFRLPELALSCRRWRKSPPICSISTRSGCRRKRSPSGRFDALTLANPKVRYQIAPDPIRHLMTAWLPKRMMDRIFAKRLGLMPPA